MRKRKVSLTLEQTDVLAGACARLRQKGYTNVRMVGKQVESGLEVLLECEGPDGKRYENSFLAQRTNLADVDQLVLNLARSADAMTEARPQ